MRIFVIQIQRISKMNNDQLFVYIDSSEDEQQFNRNNQNAYFKSKPMNYSPIQSNCKRTINSKQKNKNQGFMQSCQSAYCIQKISYQGKHLNEKYEQDLAGLISQKIDNEMVKRLLVQIEQSSLEDNIDKRNMNYKYLLQQIHTDAKYQAILQQKSRKTRQLNLRKKAKLQQHRSHQQLYNQAKQMQKYAVEKQQKRQQVIKHLNKQKNKLKLQHKKQAYNKVKQILVDRQQRQNKKLASYINQQRDELSELRQQYEQIKTDKRVNKIEQVKVINQLQQGISSRKTILSTKLSSKRQFQI